METIEKYLWVINLLGKHYSDVRAKIFNYGEKFGVCVTKNGKTVGMYIRRACSRKSKAEILREFRKALA